MKLCDLSLTPHILFPHVWIARAETETGLVLNVSRISRNGVFYGKFTLRYGDAEHMRKPRNRTDWTWQGKVSRNELDRFLRSRKPKRRQAG